MLATVQGQRAALCLSASGTRVWQGAGGNAQLAKTDRARLPLQQHVHLLFGSLPWRHEGPASKKALR